MRSYAAGGLAGCVETRISRSTGRPVSVLNAEQAGLDAGEEPWLTSCDEHGQLIASSTLRLARLSASSPLDWCGDCREA